VKTRSPIALIAIALALGACSFQNKYESEAQKITEAVMANNLAPVQGDIAPSVKITRVQVAEMSDELAEQGKLVSLKETTTGCPSGVHCFNVKFEKHDYLEEMRMDDTGKVVDWHFKMAPANAGN
jgi:hypothetical protein